MDGKGRNALHFGAILVGHVGGRLTESWAQFLQDVMRDFPEMLTVPDNDRRTPLHLLLLYLGDTAIGEREGGDQPIGTRHFTQTLKGVIQLMCETYPEALSLHEKYGLTPYDLITHRRLKQARATNAYDRSPIIRNVIRMLRRGSSFWILVHELREIESSEILRREDMKVDSILDSQALDNRGEVEGDPCSYLRSALAELYRRINFELQQHSVNIDAAQPGELTCSLRQQHICKAYPYLTDLLVSISSGLSQLARFLDQQ